MLPLPPRVPGALPLIGHGLTFNRDRSAFVRHAYAQFGPVFEMRLGPKRTAVLIGPQLHDIFFSKTDAELRMDLAYLFLKALFGEIAFTAGPERYRAERHILHSPFKGGKMPGYVAVMQEETQRWLDTLGEEGEFDLVPAMCRLTQVVAAHALMGRTFRESMTEEFWGLYNDISQSLDPILPPNLPLPKFRRRDRARKRLDALLTPVLAERKQNPDKHNDFLQEFITAKYKDGTPLTDAQIINYIVALLFAGHETTSSQVAWLTIMLLQHPDYLETVRAEGAAACPPGTAIDIGVLARLEHLTWAMRETERLRPVTDLLLRYVYEDIEAGGYRIPKGWLVMVSPPLAHRLPALYREPETFDPLRFGPERKEDAVHRFSLINFGGGVHKCTGMNFAYNEMLVVTTLLFQQFDCELLNPNPKPVYGLGATSPEPTRIRYRRRAQLATAPVATAAAVTGGCPHHAG